MLNKNYDGFTGQDLIRAMEAAYLECRYPVPKHIAEEFPINGIPGVYENPIASSGIEKLCFEFTGLIITNLMKKHNITFPKNKFFEIINGKDGKRFCNLFLKNVPTGFLS